MTIKEMFAKHNRTPKTKVSALKPSVQLARLIESEYNKQANKYNSLTQVVNAISDWNIIMSNNAQLTYFNYFNQHIVNNFLANENYDMSNFSNDLTLTTNEGDVYKIANYVNASILKQAWQDMTNIITVVGKTQLNS